MAESKTADSRTSAARKKTARKKIARKKRVVATSKRQSPVAEVPMSPAAEKLAQRLARAEEAAEKARQRITDLQEKVKAARVRLKQTGDGRARRTVEGSTDRMTTLRAKAAEAASRLREARAELQAQRKLDTALARRDSALQAAVEKFTARWLKDYERREGRRLRAVKRRLRD